MIRGHLSELMDHAQTIPDPLVHLQLTRPHAIDTRSSGDYQDHLPMLQIVEKTLHWLNEVRQT